MTTASLKLSHRLFYYIIIGTSAAAVNILIVGLLVHFISISPLLANVLGFLIAFNVSYLGHKRYTFSNLDDQKELKLMHFFIVAASAGLLNEALYYLFLEYTSIHYLVSLTLVLVLVAVYNFVVSRFWACR
ncbi:GtrA family protein [Legionella waltersii]|uniref:GtrA-like protein n=1 Tax=Legionella waltersii TaxID=66969 RepID=A0A0W1A0X6_9GAMM|nr:GtrA family protein [Legionella waltersii]KTD74707.1 GtrA-like protein [Legionella waltersii]SNU99963.1 putative GtrA-like protein [Legionella waltersii]